MASFKDIFSGLTTSGSSGGVVGIDIGSSSIKVVELKDKKGVLTLSTYGEIQLGPYASKSVGESVILTAKQEQKALVDVIRESAVTAREAVFAMPLSSSFVTNVTIDAEADADLSALVRIEARKVIPASLSEITLDWAEVDPLEKGKEKKVENVQHKILIAAIQNLALERFKVLMKFAGIKQPPTEIECFSSVRAMFDSGEAPLAIIDLGASSAKLYIAHKGLLMRMHRIRAGGAIATEKIAKELEITFEEAELKKQTLSRKDTDFSVIQKLHHGTYERSFREFKQVLNEYEVKNKMSFDAVHLSGGGSFFPGVDSMLKESLQKDVYKANPFRKVSYPAFMQDTMKEIGPSFTVALGAALRMFD